MTYPDSTGKQTPASARGVGDAGKLLPCPFCGSFPEWQDELLDVVRCQTCIAEGPWSPGNDRTQAIAAWNTRSLPTGGDDGTV